MRRGTGFVQETEPSAKNNESLALTLAPQSAPRSTQKPMKAGSASRTRMLSTQYTCTNSTPRCFMSSRIWWSASALYKPPLPSAREKGMGLPTDSG